MVTAASASETALRARPSCKALRAQPSAPHSSSASSATKLSSAKDIAGNDAKNAAPAATARR